LSVIIDRPLADVWRYVEQVERHTEWMSDAVSITLDGERTRGVGTTFECLTKVGPFRVVDRMTVTEWEPEKVMTIEHRGFVTGRGRFTLVPRSNDRTEFLWSEQLSFPWWMGGRAGVIAAKPVLRSIWRRNLLRLKQRVEES